MRPKAELDNNKNETVVIASGETTFRSLLRGRPAWWALLLFYAAYVGAGTLAQGFAIVPGIEVIFWPPVGILIATLMLNERASWPWWIIAGCAAELTANLYLWQNPLPYALIYYSGNALEALTAAWLIDRFAPKPFCFDTIEQVLAFVGLAAGIAPMVSSTVIASVDAFRGRHPFTTGWPLVWLGDATGLLISAPLTFVAVLLWRHRGVIPVRKFVEAGLSLALLLTIAALALSGPLPTIYLTFPVLLWIATRFRLKGTAVALGLLTLITGSFTVAGVGPFAAPPAAEHFNVLRFHVFLVVSAISALFVAALSQQRLKAISDLEAANRDLETRVAERTGDLVDSEYRLRLATEAAANGVWEWDLSGDRVEWTDTVFEIVGIGRENFDGTNAAFMEMIHPDDRDRVHAALASAIEENGSAESEFRVIRPDDEIRWVHERGRVIEDARGRRMVGTITDITARKSLETRSLEQFEQLENIYRVVPVGLAVIDRDLKFVRVNEWLANVNGLPAGEHVGRSVREVVPEFADQAEPILRKVVETGEQARDVILEGRAPAEPAVKKTWSEIWDPIKNESGEVVAVNVVVVDITERAWSEELLKQQNRLLELIASGHDLHVVLTELTAVVGHLEPRTRAAVVVTDGQQAMFENAYAADIPQTWVSSLKRMSIAGTPVGACCAAAFSGEAVTCADLAADSRWSDAWRENCLRHDIAGCHSEPILDMDGHAIGSLMLCFDSPGDPDPRALRLAHFGARVAALAVERSRAETSLRSARDTFQHLVDSSPFGVYVVDADFRLARASAGTERVFQNVHPLVGRDFAEVLRIVWEEPFATDAINIFRHTLETGDPYHSPRTIETRGDIGEAESYDWKLERITMPDGRFGVVCHFYDLSERLRYEKELRDAELKFRSTFEQAAVGIAQVSPDGYWMLVNDRLCEILGYRREELLRLTFQEITHPDDLQMDTDNVSKCLSGEIDHFAINKRYVRKDGVSVWVNLTVSLVRGPDGMPKYFASVVEDITDRKRAEDELRRQTELLRGITESTPDLIYAKDLSGRWIMANKATLDLIGHTEETALGRLDSDLYDPLEADAIMANDRRVLRTGSTETVEESVTSDGRVRTLLTTKNPLHDASGRVVGVVGVSHDITALKLAQTALRESETRQRLALEAGNMGTWTWPFKGRECWADARTLALFDIEPDEWTGDAAILNARRHPEDVELMDRAVAKAISERGTWRAEYRIICRDGSVRWIHGIGRLEFDDDDEPTLMRGISFDITERRRAEEELRRHHEILETTVRERTRELAEANRELVNENRHRRQMEVERQGLLAKLVAAQEEERRRMSQDLHDQLGQQLTAVSFKIEAALRSSQSGPDVNLLDARALLRRIDEDVDALAWQLRPAILDRDGFLEALRVYVAAWSRRFGVPAEMWADDSFSRGVNLTPEAETNLYRITQEALNNVAKYANAGRVEVLLNKRAGSAVLTISDDGAGFDAAVLRNGQARSMGIIGMRERAGLVGGSFEIESSQGEGTTVYVQVPISATDNSSPLMQSAGS